MFKHIKEKVEKSFSKLSKNDLFVVDLEQNELFYAYLMALPLDDRQYHKCYCCKTFLRNFGCVVAIVDNKIKTLWDFDIDGIYKDVPKRLNDIVINASIKGAFISKESTLGTDWNHQITDKGDVIKWEHFSAVLPDSRLFTGNCNISTALGEVCSTRAVFQRALNEITQNSILTILDLIAQKSLYKGDEFKLLLIKFLNAKKEYEKLKTQRDKDLFSWANFKGIGKIRNSAIGTLLVDLSNDMEINKAVGKFEDIVAPTNYKRPKALITKAMIDIAEKKIAELGYKDSLARRFANIDDFTINNALFIDRDIKADKSIFDDMKDDVITDVRKFSKIEEVSIDVFINKVLPTATSIDILFENRHQRNLMTLVAPLNDSCKSMFPWSNGLSWDYNGGVADSIKERVRSAGGKVDGVLRFSLQWNDNGNDNTDLDAWCIEPDGRKIFYNNNQSPTGGNLDIDVTKPGIDTAVENITWPMKDKMLDGEYMFIVNDYSGKGTIDGFSAEIEADGAITKFSHDGFAHGGKEINVATVSLVNNTFDVVSKIDSSNYNSSHDLWNLGTNKFHHVNVITKSPNHWENDSFGNKHLFFILKSAKNEGLPRGIFNEFLKPELAANRKVFEVLGGKMVVTRIEHDDRELSGIGFSTTQRNDVFIKVGGNFDRVIKVIF